MSVGVRAWLVASGVLRPVRAATPADMLTPAPTIVGLPYLPLDTRGATSAKASISGEADDQFALLYPKKAPRGRRPTFQRVST